MGLTNSNEMGEKKIEVLKFWFFFHKFISGMAESEATSPSAANLDFEDDTLKGKYWYNIVIIT